MSDYEAEVERVRDEVGEVYAATSGGLCSDTEHTTRRLYRQYQLAALTGNLRGLASLDAAAFEAIARSAHPADLWLLRAYIAIKRHRFADAEAFLDADPTLANSTQAKLLRGDIDLQHDRFDQARDRLHRALSDDPTWDGFARLAHLTGLLGDAAAADELYLAAEDEMTAKQMQNFAWLEVQRGVLKFQRGRQTEAMVHYHRARRAFSGYWLVDERIAELLGAQGRFAEATAIYERLHAALPRPEWKHALGDLCALAGDQQAARNWKMGAFSGYQESVASGEVFYLHLLVDLCCELAGHTEDAVRYARRDAALRGNFATHGDLAWSLYRDGRRDEALPWIERALAVRAVSPRLYTQAACIYAAAGSTELSARYMRLALDTNTFPARAVLPRTRMLQSRAGAALSAM